MRLELPTNVETIAHNHHIYYVHVFTKVKVKPSRYRPGQALWFQKADGPECLYNRHMKVVRSSALRTGCLYPQEGFLVLISVRGWVDPRATRRPEGLSHWKIPVTPTGIEPETFRLVEQCLNQLHHRVPHTSLKHTLKCMRYMFHLTENRFTYV